MLLLHLLLVLYIEIVLYLSEESESLIVRLKRLMLKLGSRIIGSSIRLTPLPLFNHSRVHAGEIFVINQPHFLCMSLQRCPYPTPYQGLVLSWRNWKELKFISRALITLLPKLLIYMCVRRMILPMTRYLSLRTEFMFSINFVLWCLYRTSTMSLSTPFSLKWLISL